MSGIAGIVGRLTANPESSVTVERMAKAMMHDKGDATGVVREDALGVCFSWCAPHGIRAQQTARWNERRDLVLAYTGDDFDLAVKAEALRRAGVALAHDADVLFHLYEKHGADFPLQLEGGFSGFLIDLRAKRALVFNDRYALNRIYFHDTPEGVYFASEAKALLAVLPECRKFAPQGLAEYFSIGCVLQDRTLFHGIQLLPCASLWSIGENRALQKRTYFDARVWEQQEPLSLAAYEDALVDTFRRITPHYLRGQERVGLSLTGGLDSRMALAWLDLAPGSLPTYTFGGPYRECADVTIARALARASGQPHTVIPIADDFFADFGRLAEHTILRSDGAMDASGAVELYVNKGARKIAPIRLTGNYGSEILRRNVAFRPRAMNAGLFTPEFASLFTQAAETYRQEAEGHRLSFIAFKQVPWHHYARRAVEMAEVVPRSPFLDNELVALAYRAPHGHEESAAPLLNLIMRGNPALDAVQTDRALRRNPVPGLSKLNNAWREFTAKAEYAYDYGMPNRLVRADHAVNWLHLEKLFLGRHKFYHFRIWYKDRLRGYLRSLQSGHSDSSACYRSGAVQSLIDNHLTGRSNHTLELHKAVAVELMEKVLLRSSWAT